MSPREFIESREEIEKIMNRETFGFLGLAHEGKPYVVPVNYCYIDGKLIFHCALTGKKLDYLKANPQVCFTVGRQSGEVRRHAKVDPCQIDSDSVICYGEARIIEDLEQRVAALNTFNRSFQQQAEEISPDEAAECMAVEILIDEMTGRREREKECSYWRVRFMR